MTRYRRRIHSRVTSGALLVAAVILLLAGCASNMERFPSARIQRFPLAEPMWEDPDREHVEQMPEEYYSPFGWDAVDQTLFRPLTRIFAVDPVDPAINVNALDEVPNSSWWQNRLGFVEFTVDDARRGACPDLRIDESGPWTITDAKPNGANPGFIIRAADGRRYLLKFDGQLQPERATTADVFGSRVYHAVGYHAPCNFIVEFYPSIFEIDPEAEAENERGDDVPMTDEHVAKVLDAAIVLPDGRLRGSASLFLGGRPLGPWRYQDTRSDDPNDVIDHQERRELRGGRVLAAWLNHFDAREMNTLAMWVEEDGNSYVRHHYIDFGDCFGSDWEIEMLTRRLGHANYFDISQVVGDFFTLGLMRRPWNYVRWSEVASIFGYFDAASFVPQDWEPGYPNPAFLRMTTQDGAWMARIMAHLTDEHIRAMLDEGRLTNPEHDAELFNTLLERRDRIFRYYLTVHSPLTHFEVHQGPPPAEAILASEQGFLSRPTVLMTVEGERVAPGAGPVPIQFDDETEAADADVSEDWLCFTDLAVQTHVVDAAVVRYETRMFFGHFDDPNWYRLSPNWRRLEPITTREPGERVCVSLVEDGLRPADAAGSAPPDSASRYAVLEIQSFPETGADPIPPIRVHMYDLGDEGFRVVGLERL